MTYIQSKGVLEDSRNGKVLSVQHPVVVRIINPRQRVLFDPIRNVNHFFHLAEAMWMLSGRNDIAGLTWYVPRMAQYSDDGVTLNAPYGHRWRKHFGYDQLEKAIVLLKNNPLDRRVVVTMWDAYEDLGSDSKDIPCHQQAMLRIVDGKLNMLTTNRSNDLVWGLCGANFVHLTILQEHLAGMLGVGVGEWTSVTNNLHVYEQHFHLLEQPRAAVEYPALGAEVTEQGFDDQVVAPMVRSWQEYKADSVGVAHRVAGSIASADWQIAIQQWLERKM